MATCTCPLILQNFLPVEFNSEELCSVAACISLEGTNTAYLYIYYSHEKFCIPELVTFSMLQSSHPTARCQ